MSERKPYLSDLSDERWALIEPVITAWKAAHPSVSGHQSGYAMRENVNAIATRAGPAANGTSCPTTYCAGRPGRSADDQPTRA
ncbi:transposase [Acrocarpospora pleiomorpha]|uniref:transposase n=1 Tax=Acrocarpospora pleiomorpha TaxID=90975 RepID=UPI001C3F5930|nr:transposase [Acrocarpospora pleiomorpha]